MFAEDLKIFRNLEPVFDYVILQKEVDVLVLWFNSMEFSFNAEKFQSMSFARDINIISYNFRVIKQLYVVHNPYIVTLLLSD